MQIIESKIRDVFVLNTKGNYIIIFMDFIFIILGLLLLLNNTNTIFFIISVVAFPICIFFFPVKIVIYKNMLLVEYAIGIREEFKLSSIKKIIYEPPFRLPDYITIKLKKRVFILLFKDFEKCKLLRTKVKYYKSKKSYI